MRTARHGALVAISIAWAPVSCVEQVVDLTVSANGSGNSSAVDERCGWRQRINPKTGHCETCIYREEYPAEICPCNFARGGGEFPYCENVEAYFECLPCLEGPENCAALDLDDQLAFGFGTASSCPLVRDCCDLLAAAGDGTEPCCVAPLRLRCALDSGNIENGPAVVSCESDPCCLGMPCSGSGTNCLAWQTCDSGRCAPACEPVLEECRASTCSCHELQSAP